MYRFPKRGDSPQNCDGTFYYCWLRCLDRQPYQWRWQIKNENESELYHFMFIFSSRLLNSIFGSFFAQIFRLWKIILMWIKAKIKENFCLLKDIYLCQLYNMIIITNRKVFAKAQIYFLIRCGRYCLHSCYLYLWWCHTWFVNWAYSLVICY